MATLFTMASFLVPVYLAHNASHTFAAIVYVMVEESEEVEMRGKRSIWDSS